MHYVVLILDRFALLQDRKCFDIIEAMKKSSNPGLPPWPRRALELASFSAAPQSILPLARSSFQGLKKPYSMNSSVTKSPFNPSDTITIPSSSADSNNKESQNLSFPIDNKNSSTKDLATDPALPSSGDKPAVKTRAMITGVQTRAARAIDPSMDPKRLKRVISNRVSAQKSRLKRLQYLADIESKVKALEEEIAALSPQVALYKSHHQALKMEQRMLSMEMSARTSNKILKDVEIEDNKAEVSRLRQLHLTQQEVMWAGWANGFNQQMAGNPNMFQLSLERIAYMTSIQAKAGESSEGTQKLKQRSGGWRCVLGRDPSEQEMANPSLHRSGPSTALNMNPQMGGVQKTMTFNSMPINQDLDK
ncbi:ACTIVATOR OF SPOMIN LUC3 [Salix koriyanagi]|uniref:ACTIVATOR OF SPOMIN LUC3 n=1 Tax=Salix koriyanagi TaxID=2511006 RepID=A0A9Q0YZZ4_9ROSI|nr:ACTIVATOR OF SPOMIN LUC3 [Salix koriyanagi]